MSDKPLMLEDLRVILRRRKWHIAIPAIILGILSGALAYLLPPVYVSTATISIEQQEVPQNLVASTVTGFAAERIEMIRSRVMTRDNLWDIAEKFDLYPGKRTLDNQQLIITQMRNMDISMAVVSTEAIDPRSGRSITPTVAFSLSYQNESPELAQKVTTELAELYLNENRRSRAENAQQTSSFLNDEAQRLLKQISDVEAKISEFKTKNAGFLPESFATTSRTLDDLQQQIGPLEARLSPLESRYSFLKSRLAGFGLPAQLASARAELATAREKYSDIHPDVARLKRTVESLEASANQPTTFGAASSDPEYLVLQSELQQVAGDIGAVRSQRSILNRKITEYESRLAQTPEVEREYLALSRDMEHAKSQYSDIMGKLTSARLAEELEREQKAERFTLTESASFPSTPSKPNRPAIFLIGLTFAIGIGIGIATLAEYLDNRIHGPKDLAAIFKAPPLAIIPEIPG